jgi:hypothetical protein
MLRVISDANGGGVAIDTHPLVGFGVFQIRRNIAPKSCATKSHKRREKENEFCGRLAGQPSL